MAGDWALRKNNLSERTIDSIRWRVKYATLNTRKDRDFIHSFTHKQTNKRQHGHGFWIPSVDFYVSFCSHFSI
jgi:hypothetical protein